MFRLMLFLSLCVAITATPARLAEAASDIGRALADADADAGMEEADGGVGDDSGDSIKLDKTHAAADENVKTGAAFLAANKSKPGVTTLPSGLQYKVLTAGTGPKPTASDTVTVNYRGTLISGKEFDSSYKRGQPATFPVGGVIKGWTEALQLMPVGSKWQLFIPADLAYGDRGAGGDIGPGETLIFEVELLSIGEPKKQ